MVCRHARAIWSILFALVLPLQSVSPPRLGTVSNPEFPSSRCATEALSLRWVSRGDAFAQAPRLLVLGFVSSLLASGSDAKPEIAIQESWNGAIEPVLETMKAFLSSFFPAAGYLLGAFLLQGISSGENGEDPPAPSVSPFTESIQDSLDRLHHVLGSVLQFVLDIVVKDLELRHGLTTEKASHYAREKIPALDDLLMTSFLIPDKPSTAKDLQQGYSHLSERLAAIYESLSRQLHDENAGLETRKEVFHFYRFIQRRLKAFIKLNAHFDLRGEPALLSIEESWSHFRVYAENSSLSRYLEFKTDVSPALPRVRIDPDLFEEVLLYVTRNAAQAAQGAGRTKVPFELRARADRSWVVLQISDDGPGIPTAVQDRLFKEQITTKPDGHGIGLNVIRDIVENAGSTIAVDSLNVDQVEALSLPHGLDLPPQTGQDVRLMESRKGEAVLGALSRSRESLAGMREEILHSPSITLVQVNAVESLLAQSMENIRHLTQDNLLQARFVNQQTTTLTASRFRLVLLGAAIRRGLGDRDRIEHAGAIQRDLEYLDRSIRYLERLRAGQRVTQGTTFTIRLPADTLKDELVHLIPGGKPVVRNVMRMLPKVRMNFSQDFGFSSASLQKELLRNALRRHVRERELSGDRQLTVWCIGLGEMARESRELVALIDEAMIAENAAADLWNVQIFGVDVTKHCVDSARSTYRSIVKEQRVDLGERIPKALNLKHLRMDAFQANAQAAAELKSAKSLSGAVRPADFILHRHVTYVNTRANRSQYEFDTDLGQLGLPAWTNLLDGYLQYRSIVLELSREGTLLFVDPVQLRPGEPLVRLFEPPGARVLARRDLESSNGRPGASGYAANGHLEDRSAGILKIVNIEAIRRMTLESYYKTIAGSVDGRPRTAESPDFTFGAGPGEVFWTILRTNPWAAAGVLASASLMLIPGLPPGLGFLLACTAGGAVVFWEELPVSSVLPSGFGIPPLNSLVPAPSTSRPSLAAA